jgi:hypothetical protein
MPKTINRPLPPERRTFAYPAAGTPPLSGAMPAPRPSETRGGPFAREGAVLRYEALRNAKLPKEMR